MYFQPTCARHAFPCWDEPLLKARFRIAMISRTDTVNLSNMPSESEKPFIQAEAEELEVVMASLSLNDVKGWKITKFQETPIVSSAPCR